MLYWEVFEVPRNASLRMLVFLPLFWCGAKKKAEDKVASEASLLEEA